MSETTTAVLAPNDARLKLKIPDPSDPAFVAAKAKVAALIAKAKASPMGIITEPLFVDYMLASALLDGNEGNRTIRMDNVRKIMDDMQFGRWQLNGETVIVAETGELNDGQHRLLAIALLDLDQPIPMMISFGATRASNATVDQGKSRTAADAFQFAGFQYPTVTAGVARQIVAYEAGDRSQMGEGKHFTPNEALERLQHDLDNNNNLIVDAVNFAKTHRANDMITSILFGFCYWAIMQANPTQGAIFLDQFATQNLIAPGSTQDALRRFLQKHKKNEASHINRQKTVEAMFRAWNAFMEGRELERISFKGQLPILNK